MGSVIIGTGVALVVGSLAVGGWERLWSPLTYQSDRGLQIEAVAATVPMRAWAADLGYVVWYSPFHAYEVTGPSTGLWLQVVGLAGPLALVGCLVLLVVWVRAGNPRSALPYLALTGIGAFVITSPALSPQYLLWIAAPTAVLLGLATGPGRWRPALAPAMLTWIAAVILCLLTTAVYPVYYDALLAVGEETPRALALLTARNAALVAFVGWTAALAWVTTRRAQRDA